MNNPFDHGELDRRIIERMNSDQDAAAEQMVDAKRGLSVAFEALAAGKCRPIVDGLGELSEAQFQLLLEFAAKRREIPKARPRKRRRLGGPAVGEARLAACVAALGHESAPVEFLISHLIGQALLTVLAQARGELGDIAEAIEEYDTPPSGRLS